MQIQLQKLYQIVLTGIGLCLFVAALMLNHSHPHNQGIASLSQNSLFKKLGINLASTASGSGLSYVSPLSKATSPPKAAKLDDPTTDTPAQPASLPTVSQAGNGDSSLANDDSNSVKSNDKSGGHPSDSQPTAVNTNQND